MLDSTSIQKSDSTDLPAQPLDLTPQLEGGLGDRFIDFCQDVISRAKGLDQLKTFELVDRLRRDLESDDLKTKDNIGLLFAKSLVLDLLKHGWRLDLRGQGLLGSPPELDERNPTESKRIIRTGHLHGRNIQLRQDSVRDFVRRMERRRLTVNGWHSIFLVDAGGA